MSMKIILNLFYNVTMMSPEVLFAKSLVHCKMLNIIMLQIIGDISHCHYHLITQNKCFPTHKQYYDIDTTSHSKAVLMYFYDAVTLMHHLCLCLLHQWKSCCKMNLYILHMHLYIPYYSFCNCNANYHSHLYTGTV